MFQSVVAATLCRRFLFVEGPRMDNWWGSERNVADDILWSFRRLLLRQTFRTSLKGVRFAVTVEYPEGTGGFPSSRRIDSCTRSVEKFNGNCPEEEEEEEGCLRTCVAAKLSLRRDNYPRRIFYRVVDNYRPLSRCFNKICQQSGARLHLLSKAENRSWKQRIDHPSPFWEKPRDHLARP